MKINILIIFFLIPLISISSELIDFVNLDNDIILIRFNDRVNYNAQLSDDKKNLFLTIKNSSNKSGINNKKIKTDLLKEVFVKEENNDLLLNIILNSSSGYNIYQLPYSNSIVIDIFDWNKISNLEDKYRSGLFAYESNLYGQAINLFNESKFEIVEAQSLLGIVYLLEDSLHLSYPNLVQAARRESTIPDVYAALSQIYKEKGNKTKSSYFEKKFFSKLSIVDSVFEYPKLIFDISKLENLDIIEVIDSSDINTDSDINNKRFSHLFDSSNAKVTTQNNLKTKLENEDAFLNLKGFFKYIFIIFLLISLLIIAIYLKWRKQRIESNNRVAKNDFEAELKKYERTGTKESSILMNRTDEEKLDKSTYKSKQNNSNNNEGRITSDKNINTNNTDLKIASRSILKDIKLKSTDSNLNLETNKLDNNKLKNQLYSKFNVSNKNNK